MASDKNLAKLKAGFVSEIAKVRAKYLPKFTEAYQLRERVELEVAERDKFALLLLLSESNIVFTFVPASCGSSGVDWVVADYTWCRSLSKWQRASQRSAARSTWTDFSREVCPECVFQFLVFQ